MRKVLFAAVLVVLMLIIIEVADANPFPMFGGMSFTIHSPSNRTYVLPIQVSFSAVGNDNIYLQSEIGEGGGEKYSGSFYYVIDDQDMRQSGIKIENCHMTTPTGTGDDRHFFDGQTLLTNLTQGPHNITVYWGVKTYQGILNNPSFAKTAQFSVGSSIETAQPSPPLSATSSTKDQPNVDSSVPIIIGALTAALALSGLFFFKRHKSNTD